MADRSTGPLLMKPIHIGKVAVPLVDYAVGASAVLGIRDSGKTVTSKGIAEQLLDNGVPIVVFDAVGKWRWMKAPAERKDGKGYKVVVAGGRSPDLPLTPHSVGEIVRAAMKERIPLVIDLFDRNLSKADWRRIVQTAIHIVHYENDAGPLHVFLEEAAEFVPQKIYDGETYAEIEKLVRMGGNASVGITLINQRSQEVNKAVLDNCSTALVLGCQVGKNAIEAVEKWMERLDPETADEITHSLPKLKSGEAWVWTRGSLELPSREKIPMCRSFHPDRRTPEHQLTSIAEDTAQFVEVLSSRIPKVIEEAKANDPALLKRQLAEARQELKKLRDAPAAKSEKVIVREKYVLKDGQLARVEKLIERFEQRLEQIKKLSAEVTAQVDDIAEALKLAHQPTVPVEPVQLPPLRRVTVRNAAHVLASDYLRGNGDIVLSGGLLEILKAAAQYPDGVTDEQISILTGYRKTSRITYRQKLMGAGYLARGGRGYVATEEGVAALGNDHEPLPTGSALRMHWMGRLSGGELVLFRQFVAAYPSPVTNDQLIQATTYQKTSVVTYKQKLTARNLIVGTRPGEAMASKELFE